jgi:large subunit ribosomal protein L25
MSSHQTLKANKREESGTTVSKRLRREGIVPAVVYGASQRSYALQVVSREFTDLLKGQSSANFLVNLEIEGAEEKSKLAMVQDIQADPLSGAIVHIDFHAVKEGDDVHATLPIELLGIPVGVKNGGVMEHQLHSIEVFCKPADLPEHLELDVSEIEVGEVAHVSDLKLPKGVETHMDDDVVIVLVAEPRVIEEEVPAEAAEGAEAGEGAEGAEGGDAEASGEGGD